MTIRCSDCGLYKGPTAFHRDRHRKNGYKHYCRACRRLHKRGRRALPPKPRQARPCEPCAAGQHGQRCWSVYAGCGCRCRAMLGLDGPFEHGDPTIPGVIDLLEAAG